MNSDSFRPSQLLFSQTSIKSTLSDGEHIPTLIHNISIGRTPIDPTWEPLDVAKDRLDGKYYCQNNRRLYIFRVLEKKGVRNQVRVRICLFSLLFSHAKYQNTRIFCPVSLEELQKQFW